MPLAAREKLIVELASDKRLEAVPMDAISKEADKLIDRIAALHDANIYPSEEQTSNMVTEAVENLALCSSYFAQS